MEKKENFHEEKEKTLQNEEENFVSDRKPLNAYEVSDEFIDNYFSKSEESEDREETKEERKRNKKIIKAKKRNRPEEKSGGLYTGLIKALLYVTFVVICGGLLAYMGISCANDLFAFVKPATEATITVDETDDYKSIADKLKENGIIEKEWLFKMFMLYQADDEAETEFLIKEHKFTADMNYSQIYSQLTVEPYVRTEVSVTVPEGYTAEQIINLLVEKDISTKEYLLYAINEYDFKHEFVRALKGNISPNRIYRLEGYLYPDTYLFYKRSPNETEESGKNNAVQVINKFLNNFSVKVWSEYDRNYKEACEKLGMTFDEIITLSSIVQMEGVTLIDFENISQVFHNRIQSKSFPKLESCATVQYILDERHDIITDADTKIDNPYNTYMYDGLPPGAICNPGINAIEAALYPGFDAQMLKDNGIKTAYFFVSDLNGKIYYAETQRGHEKNKATVDKINQQILDGTYEDE